MNTRICGGCTACCFTHRIENEHDLVSEEQSLCQHCEEGVGCNIYKSRPSMCQTFRCLWLKGFGAEDKRPDLSGVVMSFSLVQHHGFAAVFAESRKSALEEDEVQRQIQTLIAMHGIVITFDHDGNERYITKAGAILPRELIEKCGFLNIKIEYRRIN